MSNVLRVLIVGVGQIGLAAARSLLRMHAEVYLLDCAPRQDFIWRNLPMLSLDNLLIANLSDVDVVSSYVRKHAITVVVFSAGFSTQFVNRNPDAVGQLFSRDLSNFVAAIQDGGAQRLIAMSSLAVYDRHANHEMLCETSFTNARSTYSRAHLALEHTLSEWTASIDVIVLRLAGVFGVHPVGRGSSSTLLVERILTAAAENSPLTVEGYPDDADDLIYSERVGSVIGKVAFAKHLRSDTFNVARDDLVSLQQICCAVNSIFGSNFIQISPPNIMRETIKRPPMTSKKLRETFGVDLRSSIHSDILDYVLLLRLPTSSMLCWK